MGRNGWHAPNGSRDLYPHIGPTGRPAKQTLGAAMGSRSRGAARGTAAIPALANGVNLDKFLYMYFWKLLVHKVTIIAFAHTKGGVGKSTLCLLIASELARSGTRVLIIDADQKQQSCLQWVNRCKEAGTLPPNLQAVAITTTQELKHTLKYTDADVILIDVQGSMNDLLIAAIVASDLTVVPTKANVIEMVETVKLFEWAETNLKRAPLRLVLNRVDGIDTNTTAFQDAVRMIRDNKLPTFPTFVRARKVYEQFARNAGTLNGIARDPSKAEQVAKAQNNIIHLITDMTSTIEQMA